MTVTDLASRVDKSVPTVSLYMSGGRRPPPETLVKLCVAVGVSADWLLGLRPSPIGAAAEVAEQAGDYDEASRIPPRQVRAALKKLDEARELLSTRKEQKKARRRPDGSAHDFDVRLRAILAESLRFHHPEWSTDEIDAEADRRLQVALSEPVSEAG
jgi:transcriptional regulator with XRE-family HTH domain